MRTRMRELGSRMAAGAALLVQHRDADDLRAAIAEAVVDIGDGFHDLGRLHRPACGALGARRRI